MQDTEEPHFVYVVQVRSGTLRRAATQRFASAFALLPVLICQRQPARLRFNLSPHTLKLLHPAALSR